jgi:hypothetical protein
MIDSSSPDLPPGADPAGVGTAVDGSAAPATLPVVPLGSSTAAARAQDLAARLLDPSIATRVTAVREALVLAGVSIVADDGTVVSPAVPPVSSGSIGLEESFLLARGAHLPGRPWRTYAGWLHDLGWLDAAELPDPSVAGEYLLLVTMEYAAVAAALAGDEPTAVTWLLLDQLSVRRGETPDGWSETTSPDTLTITALEQQLVAYELDRAFNDLAEAPTPDPVFNVPADGDSSGDE